jgi:transcriptional regulator with XRE-family HTH domain
VSDERVAGDVDRKLGERVRARRLEISMSQERLADLLGVTFQQVQKYEKGINRIAASRLLDCARALEMPVADFFEGLDRTRSAGKEEARTEDLLAKPSVVELQRLFISIESSKVRRRVIELVRAMASENA